MPKSAAPPMPLSPILRLTADRIAATYAADLNRLLVTDPKLVEANRPFGTSVVVQIFDTRLMRAREHVAEEYLPLSRLLTEAADADPDCQAHRKALDSIASANPGSCFRATAILRPHRPRSAAPFTRRDEWFLRNMRISARG